MRTVITGLTLAALALATGFLGTSVVSAAEEASDAPPEANANVEEIARRIRDAAGKRVARMDEERLGQMRHFLDVEGDEAWNELSPAIRRVVQLRRLRDRLRTGGTPAMGMAVSVPLPEADQLAARMALWSPNVDSGWVEELASARSALADAFRERKTSRERLGEVLMGWQQAREELDGKLKEAVDELRQLASPRRQVGLTLLGILP